MAETEWDNTVTRETKYDVQVHVLSHWAKGIHGEAAWINWTWRVTEIHILWELQLRQQNLWASPLQYFRVLNTVQSRDGTSQDFLDLTGKFQNHRRLTGRSTGFWLARSTGFSTEIFCSLFNVSNKKFSKGGHGWGVKICDFARGSQKKTRKNVCVFCKNDSILRPFWV